MVCLFLVFLNSLAAQDRTSGIFGTVLDESHAVVDGAKVRATNLRTGVTRETLSGAAGAYRIPLLELGEYEVTAAKAGFKSSVHRGVVLEVDHEAVVDMLLQVGAAFEEVTVTGEARLVEATPSALSGVVDTRTIEELPLNGRDYMQLTTLETGAPAARAQSRNINNGFGIQLSLSGSRPYQNNFRLDGVSLNSYNNSTPASINGVNLGVDAIQEFSVQASTYSAQYGRAGGGIINAVTRSGGNAFHGNLFYFHRNDNLDARNFFDPGEPPEFRRHQFGGSLGGPLAKNKAFFFVNYESLREERGNTTINTTLSAEARRGDLSTGPVAVDPVMAQLAELYPLPNGDVLGDTGLFVFPNDVTSGEDFVTTRVDLNPGAYDKLFFRYSFDDGDRSRETNFALGVNRDTNRPQSAVVEETHLFSAATMNVARFGYVRTFTVGGDSRARVAGVDNPDLAFLPGGETIGIVEVSGLSDFPGGTGALDSDRHAFNSFQGNEDLTLLRGRHTLKIGALIERVRFNTNSQNRVSGEYRFKGLAKFLTNRPDRFRAQFPGSDTVRGYRQWIGAVYVQDSWKIAARLTLDLGLRYEWATVPNEVNGKVANLDKLTSPETRVGAPLFDNPSLTDIAPRVGLAWDLRGNGATVVRAGYGIYPDLILSHFLLLAGVRNPPFFKRGSTRDLNQGDFPKGGYEVFVANPDADLRVDRIVRRPSQPYVQHWNLTIEQQLDRNASFRLAYVGSHGLNLSAVADDANLVPAIRLPDGRRFFPADGQKLNPSFSAIRNRTFDAHSFYHGLQAQLRRRMSRGLQFQASYSFSKSIDDSSNFFSTSESANFTSSPVNDDPRFNRGLSGFDVRHYFAGSLLWELPSPAGGGWKHLVKGWQAGSILTYASGLPLSAWLGYDGARTKANRDDWRSGQRPDLAPGASNNPVTGNPEAWVDASAFRRPAGGFLGNLGRNTLVGPNLATVDFSLMKRTRVAALGESGAVEFRVEFFNLFNRANFDLPAPSRMEIFTTDGVREDAGRVTSAGASREIQFGLKLRF